jgi:hypothetical protein
MGFLTADFEFDTSSHPSLRDFLRFYASLKNVITQDLPLEILGTSPSPVTTPQQTPRCRSRSFSRRIQDRPRDYSTPSSHRPCRPPIHLHIVHLHLQHRIQNRDQHSSPYNRFPVSHPNNPPKLSAEIRLVPFNRHPFEIRTVPPPPHPHIRAF